MLDYTRTTRREAYCNNNTTYSELNSIGTKHTWTPFQVERVDLLRLISLFSIISYSFTVYIDQDHLKTMNYFHIRKKTLYLMKWFCVARLTAVYIFHLSFPIVWYSLLSFRSLLLLFEEWSYFMFRSWVEWNWKHLNLGVRRVFSDFGSFVWLFWVFFSSFFRLRLDIAPCIIFAIQKTVKFTLLHRVHCTQRSLQKPDIYSTKNKPK